MKALRLSGRMRRFLRFLSGVSLFLIILPLRVSGENSPEKVLKVMEDELYKNLKKLHVEDYSPPYFMAYRVVEIENYTLSVNYGAVVYDDPEKYRVVYVETRYGSYKLDNTSDTVYTPFHIYRDFDVFAPIEDDFKVLRHRLWLLSEVSYKEAVSNYFKKKAQRVIEVQEDEGIPDFSQEKKVVHVEKVTPHEFNVEEWKEILKDVSEVFREYKDILDSNVRMDVELQKRYFVNSEGTRVFTYNTYYYIKINARTLAEDGMPLYNYRTFFELDPQYLPDRDTLIKTVREMADELVALKNAPVMEPYTGPAILSPETAGVLFHEVIGHRLEGERQRGKEEGMTFKNKIGERILPEFITVIDDPTQKYEDGKALSGYYEIDDEGVPAQRTVLIENGVLKGFLMSRRPVKGFLHSNGHGRADERSKPMARMGNLIIRSSKTYSMDELERKLLELLKESGKKYGFILQHVKGGETNTSKYGFQAFKGEPIIVYKVYAEDGRKELVRGVDIVGTPLTILNKIIATGDKYEVFNGVCGAESGYVPVSTVAPALLVEEIELQRKNITKQRPFVLKPQW